MYKIEKTSYGIKLTFGGFIQKEEMAQWVTESEKVLSSLSKKFGVMVDMRELKPLTTESQLEMQKGQKLFKTNGMERSVVILNDPIITMQFKRIAKETGIYLWERYIDASKRPNWEELGKKWLINAIDEGL
jgi:hypothetical protein